MCLCNAQEKTTPSCCCCGQYVKLLIKAVTNLQANVKINKVTDVSHLSHTFTFMTIIMFYISWNLITFFLLCIESILCRVEATLPSASHRELKNSVRTIFMTTTISEYNG